MRQSDWLLDELEIHLLDLPVGGPVTLLAFGPTDMEVSE